MKSSLSMDIPLQRRFSAGHLTVTATGDVLSWDAAFGQISDHGSFSKGSVSIEVLFAAEGCRMTRHYMNGSEHGYKATFQTDCIRANGMTFPVEVHVQCSAGSAGHFDLEVEYIFDIFSEKYRSFLMQTSIDQITDMIVWLDPEARYMFVNTAATQLLGYSAEELLHMRVWDVDPLFNEKRWHEHWSEIEERGSFKIETVNRSRTGVDIPIEVTTNFVSFNGRSYNCSVVRDLREQKRAEAEMKALHEKIFQLSITDSLTGLANRRQFDLMFESELKRQEWCCSPLSLIMLDVDYFKAFNDHYGHTEGDACLRHIGEVLSQATQRAGDLAARYGGEEFMCILPDTDHRSAQRMAHDIRNKIVDLAIPHVSSSVAQVVTASLGVLTISAPALHSPQALLSMVDRLLYHAKKQGRNRVATGEIGGGGAQGPLFED